MRLLFVHGINHQNLNSEWVRENWLGALQKSLTDEELDLIKHQDISAPYYGDVLHQWTERLANVGDELQPQGAEIVSGDEAEFYRDYLVEVAKEKNLPYAEIETEERAVPQGPFYHNRKIIALTRVIERLSPLHGRVLLRVLPQAFTYLRRAQASKAVDEIVEPEIAKGPCIVVAHSLGTIVAFKLLRKLRHTAPYFITLGSPLAIQAVQNPIGTPFGRRPAVDKWINALDPDDFVTLGKPLDEASFGRGIENISDVENGYDDPHDFRMYLRDHRVAKTLVESVRATDRA